jgi:hypothetical protein
VDLEEADNSPFAIGDARSCYPRLSQRRGVAYSFGTLHPRTPLDLRREPWLSGPRSQVDIAGGFAVQV